MTSRNARHVHSIETATVSVPGLAEATAAVPIANVQTRGAVTAFNLPMVTMYSPNVAVPRNGGQ